MIIISQLNYQEDKLDKMQKVPAPRQNKQQTEKDYDQETDLLTSKLEPPQNYSRIKSADDDVHLNKNSQELQTYLEKQIYPQYSLKADPLSPERNAKKHKSFVDTITVQIVSRSFSSSEVIAEPTSPIFKSRLSRRGLSLVEETDQFLESIQFSQLQRWFLLIVSAFCNAMVPCWMTVDLKCEGITRSAWRIFTLTILLIPFVISQQKSIQSQSQKFRNLLRMQNLRKIYISSINYSVWVLFGVMSIKLTARSHSFCFLRIKFFFVTLSKLYSNRECHEGQIGGLLLVSIGILMMLWDSLALPVGKVPNIYYLSCSWWQRLLGDLFSMVGCIILLLLEKKYEMPKGPRFSTLCIYNACITINLVALGYYFGGAQFSFDPKFGVFGLFTSANFVGVFYVSIMLGLNLVIANVLVNQIFSQVIRNIAACFEIVITTTIYHVFSIQELSTGITSMGLCFLVPGMMMIVGGQGSLQKLEMKINSEIYTAETVVLNKPNQITEITLRPVQNRDLLPTSQDNLTSIEQVDSKSEKNDVSFKSFKDKME